jgi:hypothetical protein
MKNSRNAYIASFGTTGVMVASSLLLLAIVSTLVAFNGWPSAGGLIDDIESVVVNDQPPSVQIGGPAQLAADAAPAAAAVASTPAASAGPASDAAATPGASGPPGAIGPGGGGNTPRTLVRQPEPPSRSPAPSSSGASAPAAPVARQVQGITGSLGDTTENVTGMLGATVGVLSPGLGKTVTDAGKALSEVVRNLGINLTTPPGGGNAP